MARIEIARIVLGLVWWAVKSPRERGPTVALAIKAGIAYGRALKMMSKAMEQMFPKEPPGGEYLDRLAMQFGVERIKGESDFDLRARLRNILHGPIQT